MHIFIIFSLLICILSFFHGPIKSMFPRINGYTGNQKCPATDLLSKKDVHPRNAKKHETQIYFPNNRRKQLTKNNKKVTKHSKGEMKNCSLTQYEGKKKGSGLFNPVELTKWVTCDLIKIILKGSLNIFTFGSELFSGQFTLSVSLLALLKSLYNLKRRWNMLKVVPEDVIDEEIEVQIGGDPEKAIENEVQQDSTDANIEEFITFPESSPSVQDTREESSEEFQLDIGITDPVEVSFTESLSVLTTSDPYIEEHQRSHSEDGDEINEDRLALLVPSEINWEIEEYLQTMNPSMGDILCSLHTKTEEYLQAEQADDDDSVSGSSFDSLDALERNPKDIKITETQSEDTMSISVDLQDDKVDSDDIEDPLKIPYEHDEVTAPRLQSMIDQVIGEHLQTEHEDIMLMQKGGELLTTTNEVVALFEGSESQSDEFESIINEEINRLIDSEDFESSDSDDIIFNSDYSSISHIDMQTEPLDLSLKKPKPIENNNQNNYLVDNRTFVNKGNANCDQDRTTASSNRSPNQSFLRNEIIPETVNVDGTVKLVLYTPDGEPYILDCIVLPDN